MKGIKILKTLLNKYIQLNKLIVEQAVAVVPALKNGNRPISDLDIEEDFIYFCFTKLTKTMLSIKKLIDNGLYEDALILTRSNYENYLFAKSVIMTQGMIDNFVEYKLGLINEKKYKYTDFYKGHIIDVSNPKKKIQITREISSIAKAAKEKAIHNILYPYLCDMTHCNFVTSSYYRDGIDYSFTLRNQDVLFNVLLWNVYLNCKFYNTLMKAEIFEIDELEERVLDQLNNDSIKIMRIFELEEKRILKLLKDNELSEEGINDLNVYIEELKTLKQNLWI